MKPVRAILIAVLVVVALVWSGDRMGAVGQPPQDQIADGISPEALAQISALLADKDSRTPAQTKIDSQLLFEARMESGAPIADGIWAIATDLPYAADGHVVVDVRAQAGRQLRTRLEAAGVEIESASDDGSDLRVHTNIAEVDALAADPDVLFIGPRPQALLSQPIANLAAPTGQGSRSSEGDVAHLAFAARGAFHVDGSGVKIGVLSDGVRSLTASQAAGDLPAVTVIGPAAPCAPTSTCDEGTAMLEVIHDLAPGAQLYFASAFVSIDSFAANIRALRAAGCDIIVDDVSYPVESPFQDGQAPGVVSNTNGGVVIEAVSEVTADGALYFSAAGNAGNLDDGTSGVWEGNFADGGPVVGAALAGRVAAGARVHRFVVQNFNVLTAVGSRNNLYWSDPLGGSSNDYDLFLLDSAGTTVLSAGVNLQTGTQDPYEEVVGGAAGNRLVVVRSSGASRFLHVNTNRGRLLIRTAGQTHGHSSVEDAFSVAATPAGAAFPLAFSAGNTIETFSSDGPRRVFFRADGTEFTPGDRSATGGIVRQKPDITAADGVSVSGVGGFGRPFFGTSAAAAHAAAIAALVKSANPAFTPAQIRSALTSTAIDIEAPGVDRDSGAGIVMARAAVEATGAIGTAFLQLETVQLAENPGDRDGVVDPGEGAGLTLTLKNYGVAPATGIQASVTSPTSDIVVDSPNSRRFADLVPLATGSAAPIRVTIGHDIGCATSGAFIVRATYGNGGPLEQRFAIPIGLRTLTFTQALDGSTPPSSPGVTTAAGVQIGRLFRDGNASACGVQKVISSGSANPVDAASRRFQAYEIRTCANSGASCATVTLEGPNAANLFTAAYAPTFNPASILENYRADAGASAALRTYSFDVVGGAQSFVIDVHDVPPDLAAPSGSLYKLTVSGICAGKCDPPNHPPVAVVKDVTVAADATCVADASIDGGSSDADGDPLTLAQLPAAPYPLGNTNVRLTVTDPKGAFSQATADVTVVDRTGPAVTGPVATPAILGRPSHGKLVDVTVDFEAVDNCSAASCVLTVTSDTPSNSGSDGDADGDSGGDPDAIVVDVHHVKLKAERSGNRDHVYTLTLTCTDAAGNRTVRTTTVLVPRERSGGDDNERLTRHD